MSALITACVASVFQQPVCGHGPGSVRSNFVCDLYAEAADLDLVTLTLVDALDGLAAGTLTAELLTEAFLARIAVYEPTYNAFTAINEAALEQVCVCCACLHTRPHLWQAVDLDIFV